VSVTKTEMLLAAFVVMAMAINFAPVMLRPPTFSAR
jgi:hypothetical protein